jgi:hypothetical protein
VESRPQALGRERLIPLLLAVAIAPETPRAFLERTYSSYRNSGFSPLEKPGRTFSPQLSAAILEDRQLAHGEVGFLDGDPLCDCQDTLGMRSRIVWVAGTRAGASARISLNFSGTSDRRLIRVKLVKTPAGWRIADVGTTSEPSLLHDLLEANRKARRH